MLADDSDFRDVRDDVYNAILAAEHAAEGAALRASARAALLHWAALALLGVSLLICVALLLVSQLRPWSEQAAWVLILGVVSYVAVVAIVYWTPAPPSAPELRKVLRIRYGIAALLVERQASRGARRDPVLLGALADAIRHLDEQIIPALYELLERRSQLDRELGRYERQELHAPAPEVLERLQRIRARLQAAIDECVQQAANAYATLVALLQEGDDASVAARARGWADDLGTLYDSLAEVLRGEDDPVGPDGAGSQHDQPIDGRTDGRTDAPIQGNLGDRPARDEMSGAAVRPDDASVQALAPLVEEALRRINDPARLKGCGLIAQLPLTIAATCRKQSGSRGEPTSLEQARALREVVTSTLRRLRPDDASARRAGGEMLRFHVLWDLYVDGKPGRQIIGRFSISESTLRRYRRDAVRVVAHELSEQEARYVRDEPDAASG